MAWTPNSNEPEANFEEPICDNVLTIVTRDFKGGLDYYGELHDWPLYDDFRERQLGQFLGLNYPAFAVGPRSNPTEDAPDRSHIIEAARLSLRIGVTESNPTAVTYKIMRYVKVMDSILRSARREFLNGLSNGFGVMLDIEHNYGPTSVDKNDNSILFRMAFVEVVVNVRER